MIRVSLHIAGGTKLSFDCPVEGVLYDQVASLAIGLGDVQSNEAELHDQNVELQIKYGATHSGIALARNDVLAVETQPAHAFKFTPAVNALASESAITDVEATKPLPIEMLEPTPPGPPVKLTIGMATYDDYDGVYFTVQALRLYHPEIMDDVEIIVIDNNPTGPCALALKQLESHIPNYRYLPYAERSGTTVREMVFTQSNGTYVMVMDCHVLVVPGALQKLMDYFDKQPDTIDFLQGPLLGDNLADLSTHFKPEWRDGLYGFWDFDEAGRDVDGDPFDIPMQGLGLFACRRDAWRGFSNKFSGFGGEEGYIHEKFRQGGARTLCLPFLRWVHRFDRPLGVPYANSWEDRIRNYFIGHQELGLDISTIADHFRKILLPEMTDKIYEKLRAELDLDLPDNQVFAPSKSVEVETTDVAPLSNSDAKVENSCKADEAVVAASEGNSKSTRTNLPVKLTIGMATYDDYDGVYFTVQALRLYHPEIMQDVEFVIVDNNPSGPCAEALQNLEDRIPNYRYLAHTERSGTTVRELVFTQANGTYVMCMDCHVFVVPAALKRLMDYFEAHPNTLDLLQGPMLYDDLKNLSTHFEPKWSGGMFGKWAMDAAGSEVDAPAFDIPMQGLGLFACRREAWPGFSDKFSGFGGEEGYIHEKFRQAGARTLCLPFLRWVHRFNRPMGVPYANNWDDRVRNYLIGHLELGLDIGSVTDHFEEFLEQPTYDRIMNNLRTELDLQE